MKGFTVVGFYENDSQVWVEHVIALNAEKAVAVAVHQIADRNGIPKENFLDYAQGICVVEVFAGLHSGLLESTSTFSAYDHPEVNCDKE